MSDSAAAGASARGRGGRGGSRGGRGGRGRGGERGGKFGNHNHRGHKGPRPPRPERPPLPEVTPLTDVTQEHEPTQQRLVNAQKDVKQREVKKTSQFYDLLTTLSTVDGVVAYVKEHHNTVLRQPKALNSFLQALSRRPTALYDGLFAEQKSTALAILERLTDQCSGKQAVVQPQAHEFCLHCEEYGMKKALWAQGVEPLEGCSPALLSPKEMLIKIALADPQGRVMRRIEMCRGPKDFIKLAKFLSSEEFLTTASAANASVALGRLVSKTRRVMELALRKIHRSQDASKHAPELNTTADNEEKEAVPTGEEEEVQLFDVVDMKAACTAVLEASKSVMARLGEGVLAGGALSSTAPLPVAKVKNLLEWCKTSFLLDESMEEMVVSLAEQSATGMELQALQLEAVMKLKAVTTPEELKELLKDLLPSDATEDCGYPFKLRSPDVLSAVSVAASGSTMTQQLKTFVTKCLIATQKDMTEGSQLPRRALNFVTAEKNRIKQEKRAQQLKEAAAEESLGRKRMRE